jgi:ABC-type polysaccharide/polyol phosphate export permease
MIQKLKSTLGLSLALAKAQFKLKNEGTWLGVLWYLLAPILTFLFMLGIFHDRLGNNIPNYPLYLLLGIILFNFFRKIADESVAIIKNRSALIKSLNFPRESLILSIVLKTLFSHMFEIIILILFLLFFKIPISTMIYYPIVLIFLTMFTIGASLILSSLGAYFFDLHQIWGFAANIIWFVTPIFYSIGGQDRLFIINLFNPLYYIITFARDLIIYNKLPDLYINLGTIGYSLLFLTTGLFMFNKLRRRFAELI